VVAVAGKQLTPSAPFGPPSVSTAKRQAVTARVLQSCDATDGLVDGQITDPRQCRFDIDTMGPSGDGTLTADEVAVFKAMYAGTTTSTGVQRYTGARLGSEADWSPLFATTAATVPSSAITCIRWRARRTTGGVTSTGTTQSTVSSRRS